MISMRYGQRLAEGKGLTWTDGAKVEGYSNLMWTLMMAAVQRLGATQATASAWILALNAVCLGWLACAVRRLARALGAGAWAAVWAGIVCAFSFDFLRGALSGLEMVAVAALTAEALAQGAEAEAQGRAWRLWPFALAGMLALVRVDGAWAAGLILGLGLRRERRWRRWAFAAGLALGPAFAAEIFRLVYYGAWVPNTYLLKADYWPGKYGDAAAKLGLSLLRYPGAALAALGALGIRRLRPYGAVLAALALYCIWSGEDYYDFFRFFAPGFPLLFALAFAVVESFPGAKAKKIACAALAVLSLNALTDLGDLFFAGWDRSRELVEIGVTLGRKLPANDVLASCWAGDVFYFSGLRGVDLLGKCDAHVAAVRPDPSLGGSGHNKMDLEYSFSKLKPDWILVPVPTFSARDEAYTIAPYDLRVLQNSSFQKHCYASLEQISPRWALCHCRW